LPARVVFRNPASGQLITVGWVLANCSLARLVGPRGLGEFLVTILILLGRVERLETSSPRPAP